MFQVDSADFELNILTYMHCCKLYLKMEKKKHTYFDSMYQQYDLYTYNTKIHGIINIICIHTPAEVKTEGNGTPLSPGP